MYDFKHIKRRHKYCKLNRCSKRPSFKITITNFRIRKQRRFPQTLRRNLRLQTPPLNVPSPPRPRLLALARHHAPRRQAAQHHDRPQAGQGAAHRLGTERVLLPQ